MSRSKRHTFVLGAFAGLCLLAYGLFPGRRLPLAFTLATGIGTASVQTRIAALEDKAVQHAEFSTEDRDYLRDFYGTLATGAKLSIVVRQTGQLMTHYLDGSGTDYQLAPSIFRENAKVQRELRTLTERAAATGCRASTPLTSPTFYMPDSSKIDSVFGLYHGTLSVRPEPLANGGCQLHVRAEVPWFWPSYASLKQKYGTPHAESFPLPNLRSLLFGRRYALFVDNGLGETLVGLGLAKPFLAFAEWDSTTQL